MKPQHLHKARALFPGTGVVITDAGKYHLGSALRPVIAGTDEFLNSYVLKKVSLWVGEMEKHSEIAVTQPHAAYTAFTHVFLHCWSYIARMVPMATELFHPLDDVLSLRFLPVMTGQPPTEQELLSLPARLSGLGVIVPTVHFSSPVSSSSHITAPIDSLLPVVLIFVNRCTSANMS